MKELDEIMANQQGLRATFIEENACKTCGGDVMTKYKYGIPETACMQCGLDPKEV